MKRNLMGLSTLVLSLVVLPAAADDDGLGIGVAGRVGSLGYGVEVGYRFNRYLGVRGGINKGSYDYSATDSGIPYDYQLKFDNIPVLLDWHVFGGTFRFTGGLINNSNKLTGRASGNIDINGTVYATTVTTDVGFEKSSPYLGFGWGGVPSMKRGFGMSVDIGVVSHGSPTATMTATGGGVNPADLAAEQAALNDELKGFKYWPVIAVSIGYSF